MEKKNIFDVGVDIPIRNINRIYLKKSRFVDTYGNIYITNNI